MDPKVRVVNASSNHQWEWQDQHLVTPRRGPLTDYKLPPRQAYYKSGDVKLTFDTYCEQDKLFYTRVDAQSALSDEFKTGGDCPIDLFVDQTAKRLYVLHQRSNNLYVFYIVLSDPYLKFVKKFDTQVGPFRMVPAFDGVHVVGANGRYRVFTPEGSPTVQEELEGEIVDILEYEKEVVFILATKNKYCYIYGSIAGKKVEYQLVPCGGQFGYTQVQQKVYVTNYLNHSVSVFNLLAGDEHPPIALDFGSYPFDLVLNHNSRELYVTASELSKVYIIDTEYDTVSDAISVGAGPRGIAISKSACVLAVVNGDDKSLSVIDPATRSELYPPIPLIDPKQELWTKYPDAEPWDVWIDADGIAHVVTEFGESKKDVQAYIGCGTPIPQPRS